MIDKYVTQNMSPCRVCVSDLSGKQTIVFTDQVYQELVSRCLKLGQPQTIISGLTETFIKRYIVERTNKAELRPEEQE